MFGLNDTGFKRKRYIDVLTTLQGYARNLFGDNINVSENSPLGMILKIVSFGLGVLWQVVENVYFAAYKNSATGVQLDYVCQYAGITRKPAVKATGTVIFTGVAGTVIPANFIVMAGNVQYWTLHAVEIDSGGTISAEIQALESGTVGNVSAGEVNKLFRVLTGVTSVVNTLAISGGEEKETDHALSARYDLSIASGGTSTAPSIEASILAVTDVITAIVTENDTNAEVGGIPAKSFESFVYGGADSEIAQAIFDSKGAGIRAYGTTTVSVDDSHGVSHTIGFTRPDEVDIYVNITLTKNSSYPGTGDTTIETLVIEYIGGTDSEGDTYNGLGIGDDVIYTKIIGLCHDIAGVDDVVVELSTDGITYSAANIAITGLQVAVTDIDKVVIS